MHLHRKYKYQNRKQSTEMDAALKHCRKKKTTHKAKKLFESKSISYSLSKFQYEHVNIVRVKYIQNARRNRTKTCSKKKYIAKNNGDGVEMHRV